MDPTPQPLAASNPRIKQLRRLLGRRSARRDADQFVLEGPISVAEALAAGVVVREVYVDAELVGSDARPTPWPWLADVPAAALWPVARGVLERVLDTTNPQPVAAIVDRPHRTVDDVLGAGSPTPFVMVLAGVADPGNVGTIIRSAVAAGAVVVVTEGSADPFGPKAVRASAGAVLRVALAECTATELVSALASVRVPVWVADSDRGTAPEENVLSGPVALVVGNEAHGVPSAIADSASGHLHLPMAGGTESLNAAMAASILLFDVARQRRTGGTR